MRTVKFFFIILAAMSVVANAMDEQKKPSKEESLEFACKRFNEEDFEIQFKNEQGKLCQLILYTKTNKEVSLAKSPKNECTPMIDDDYKIARIVLEKFKETGHNNATMSYTKEDCLQLIKKPLE